ncbi:MAG: hypothetical protein ACOC80_13330 [Petrotogales bacterium]
MSKKITDKIKEMLTPEDLKVFEQAIEKMLDKRVALKEEEIKAKYDELAEEYVTKQVAEELENAKAALIEEYDGKLKGIEQKVVTKLGSFLDHVITEQISEESIEKLAINEIAMPVVEQIKSVFTNNFVELDTDGSGLLKKEQKRVAELESELSEAHAKIMESEERLEKSASFLLMSEKTEGLTKTQKQRVAKMFKNKKFNEIKEGIDTFVDMIKESASPAPKSGGKGTLDDIITEEDHVADEKKSVIEEKEEFSFAEKANRYMDE